MQRLYETAQFYERTDKAQASVIYYQNAITQFPDTKVADRCRNRLRAICPQALENEIDIGNATVSIEE